MSIPTPQAIFSDDVASYDRAVERATARHHLKVPPGAPATEEGGLADGYGGVTAVAAPVAVDDFNPYYSTALKRARAAHLRKWGVEVLEGAYL